MAKEATGVGQTDIVKLLVSLETLGKLLGVPQGQIDTAVAAARAALEERDVP